VACGGEFHFVHKKICRKKIIKTDFSKFIVFSIAQLIVKFKLIVVNSVMDSLVIIAHIALFSCRYNIFYLVIILTIVIL